MTNDQHTQMGTINNTLEKALEEGIISSIPTSDAQKRQLIQAIIKRQTGDRKAPEPKTDDELYYERLIEENIESGLPVPHEIEGDPPTLPLDLTELSNKEVRYMHGAFNACAARAGWLYSLEEAGESAAKQIADYREEEYITTLGDERKDFGGKPKPQALLKAEAKNADPDIVKWRKLEQQHSIAANKYKRLLDSYINNCDRLSREWTMRENERESS